MIVRLGTVEKWREALRGVVVQGLVVFKSSPTCFLSQRIEERFRAWYAARVPDAVPPAYQIDVFAARDLSHHVADTLVIPHESPQVIWLDAEGDVVAHASHGAITPEWLDAGLGRLGVGV
jgi:bacillithiol system protein YtxJ